MFGFGGFLCHRHCLFQKSIFFEHQKNTLLLSLTSAADLDVLGSLVPDIFTNRRCQLYAQIHQFILSEGHAKAPRRILYKNWKLFSKCKYKSFCDILFAALQSYLNSQFEKVSCYSLLGDPFFYKRNRFPNGLLEKNSTFGPIFWVKTLKIQNFRQTESCQNKKSNRCFFWAIRIARH